VDPNRNAVEEDHPIVHSHDYDSAFSLTTGIVVDSTISVYPVPNPVETLTMSIHLKYPIVRGDVSELESKSCD
jgi:hypothetical protein